MGTKVSSKYARIAGTIRTVQGPEFNGKFRDE
jgi:hypothetical protein